MNCNSSEKAMENRNSFFTYGGLVILVFLLAFAIERNVLVISPHISDKYYPVVKTPAMERAAVIPKTKVNIQPLVTKFPPLPDFSIYEQIDQRKAAFIDYMTPIVEYQNQKILGDRNHLEQIAKLIVNSETLPDADKKWLEQLAKQYDVEWQEDDPGAVVINLARRVDIIPLSLALVQAAKESSWGRSRYAVQANNLFGQWCYDQGCGVVPGERAPDAGHEVKRFKSVSDATRSYIHNLNTHTQYEHLRRIRQNLRIYNQVLTGNSLADGLLYYSERRHAYVEEVKAMIQQYRSFQERRAG